MRELVVFLLSYHPQLAADCIYVLLNIDLLFVVSEFLRLRQMSKSVKKQITLIPALRGLSQKFVSRRINEPTAKEKFGSIELTN